jgi:hypothetical protein
MLKIYPRKIVYTLVLLATGVTIVRAQFDTNIFTRKAPYWPESVVYMGDQNSDGYDDFLLLELDSNRGSQGKACLFYGGNPVSMVPVLQFPFESPRCLISCDINRDGKRDIILQKKEVITPQFWIFIMADQMSIH